MLIVFNSHGHGLNKFLVGVELQGMASAGYILSGFESSLRSKLIFSWLKHLLGFLCQLSVVSDLLLDDSLSPQKFVFSLVMIVHLFPRFYFLQLCNLVFVSVNMLAVVIVMYL